MKKALEDTDKNLLQSHVNYLAGCKAFFKNFEKMKYIINLLGALWVINVHINTAEINE